MLQKTNSHFVISQPNLAPLIAKVRGQLEAKHWALREEQLPDLYAIFPTLMDEPDVVQHYPPAPRKPDWDDDCVYIHSSGSTGHPKPIPQAHRQVLDWCTSGAWLTC